VSFLIVSTLVVFYDNWSFIQSKDLGVSPKDQVLIVDDVYIMSNKPTAFKEEVEQLAKWKVLH